MLQKFERLAATLCVALCTVTASVAQEAAELTPVKDNTLYESQTGALSNGSGTGLFFGNTNQAARRRAVMAFDVASAVPAGSTILSATLQVRVTMTIAGIQNVNVHRLEKDWGEGASDAGLSGGSGASAQTGDATWKHTFFNTEFWTADGGDFDQAVVTSAAAGGGAVEFPSTTAFVSLVQSWVDAPEQNFGIILIGNEETSPSAKRIGSREGAEANRPKLILTYNAPTTASERDELPRFLTSLSTYPNPAGPEANVEYSLVEPRHVQIELLDVTGRLIRSSSFGVLPTGEHKTTVDTRHLTPGLYLIRLVSGGESTGRMILVQ